MSHSPGPWVHEYRDGGHPKNVSHKGWGSTGLWDAEGNLILGTGLGWDAAYEEPKKKEDWLLIQAAPEMLALLKDLCTNYELGVDVDRQIGRVVIKAGGFL